MRQKLIFISTMIATFFIGIIGTIFVIKLVPTKQSAVETTKSNITLKETDSLNSSYLKVNDATVYIESTVQSYQGTGVSSGTGFFYKKNDKKAYILTNNHVVEGASKVEVTTTSGQKYDATVVGTDVYTDIAVLSVDKDVAPALVEIGSSADINIGDTVFTVGSPLGIDYINSMTKGIISGKDRTIEVSLSTGDALMEVIQIDAAINPGNSGGPLCNVNGEVIGINSLKLVQDEVEGMGFAIPIEYAMTIAENLETGKETARPYFGMESISVNDPWQLYKYGITVDSTIKNGIVVTNLYDNYPAADAGLKKGDVLVEFDGTKIKSLAHFRFLLYKHKVGDTVKIKYYRNKDYKEVSVVLNKSTLDNK